MRRLVPFACAAVAWGAPQEQTYDPAGSSYADLPAAAEPFRSQLEGGDAWLVSKPSLLETETEVGFDTRAVSIRQYLKSDSAKGLDSTVLWESYYPELSDYLAEATLERRRELADSEMTARRAADDTSSAAHRFELPVKVPEWAKKLGIDKPNLSLSGDYKFKIKSSSHWTNVEEDAGTASKVPSFEPDQEPNVNLVGSIGKLIHVQLSWTKDGFGVSNNQLLQIKYAGEKPEDTEDDILQEAEFGYINFDLSGTALTGYTEQASGLIGAKAKMKFGDLDATVIVGGEKGENQHQKLGAGATSNVQTIDDRSPAQGGFFLDENFRTEFDNVAGSYSAMSSVSSVRLFVRISATVAKNNPSWAPFWKGSAQGYDASGLATGSATNSGETWVELTSSDFSTKGGVVFLNNTTRANYAYNTSNGALGAIYTRSSGKTFGGVKNGKLNLALLYLPADPSEIRPLALRNRYKMPFTSVATSDRAYVKVRVLDNSSTKSDKSVNDAGVDLAKYFGLLDDDGNPKVSDNNIFDWDRMEISFPSAAPFSKTGRTDLYDTAWSNLKSLSSRYSIEVTAKSRTSVFKVTSSSSVSSSNCLDIIEGSEVLTLNGSTKLVKGVDYDVSYSIGQITLLSSRALDPSADIQIDYQCTPFFSLDTRTLLGGRLEYELPVGKSKESILGATVLYRSETVTDNRAQLGREPNSAWLWGANLRLQSESELLSDLAGYVPLVTPHGDSKWKLELEAAQTYNNPNTDGEALVDDFESSKLGNSLPITRTSWTAASPPGGVSTDTSYDASHDYRHKGTFVWHSNSEVAKADIYPNWDDGTGTRAKQYIMQMKLTPNDPGLGYSWGGIMRAFSSQDLSSYKTLDVVARASGGVLYFDFGDISEAISFAGRSPADTLMGEDVDSTGEATGTAIDGKDLGLDQIPDALETANRWYCPGVDCGSPTVITSAESSDPAGKQFNPQSSSSDPDASINGTEGNNRYMDNGAGTWFDSEDLNNNGKLDVTNAFNRFVIRFGGDSASSYEKLKNGWRLYHIRLEAPQKKIGGGASWDAMKTVRIWYSGLTAANGANQQEDRVQIAEMSLTGNQYTEAGRITRNDTSTITDSLYTGGTMYHSVVTTEDTNSLRVGVVNRQSNSDIYESWGVPTATDASTGAVENEQSLRLQYNGLRTFGELDSAAGTATRTFTDTRNLTLYKKFSLLVYHHLSDVTVGGLTDSSELKRLRDGMQKPVRFFLRMGSGTPDDTTAQYYEYSWNLRTAGCVLGDALCSDDESVRRAAMDAIWQQNRLSVPLEVFTGLKDSGTTAERKTRIYRASVPQSKMPLDVDYSFRQDSVAIKGNPSLSNIQWVQYIIRPDSVRAGERLSGEVWVNDMKVENAQKGVGTALRGSFEFNLADLLSASVSSSITDGNYTALGTRRTEISSEATTGTASFDSRLSLNKFMPESWKVEMPIGYSMSTSLSRPWMRPGSDVPLTHDGIGDVLSDIFTGNVERDSGEQSKNTSRAFQTYSVTKKISWNYRKESNSGRQAMDYLVNILFERPRCSWVYTTAHSEQPERTDSSQEHSMELDYDFSPKVKPLKLFSQAPKWLPPFISRLEFQPLPSKLEAVVADIDYTESVRRTLDADNDTLIALDRQRKATLSHSFTTEWTPVNFLKLGHKIQVSRTFDSTAARSFDPAAGFSGMAGEIFSGDTTIVDSVTGKGQDFWLLKGEQSRTQSLSMDLSPQLTTWLTTTGSFATSSTLSRLSPTVLSIDTATDDTLKARYWQGTTKDGFRAQFRWNTSAFMTSLSDLLPDSWSTSVKSAKEGIDAIKFSGISLEYSNDNSSSGADMSLAYLNHRGLDGWTLERYLLGLGDEDGFRSPWDWVTGSRNREGIGQYEPWRLGDSAWLNASKTTESIRSSGANLTDLANQHAYRVTGSTDFMVPGADLTLRPSLAYSTSWTENWNDPINVDTTIVWPQITVSADWANWTRKIPFLSRYFQSVTMNHSIGYDLTQTIYPHSQTSDTKTENWKFSPLVGLNLRTKNGLWTFDNKFNWSWATTWNYEKVQRAEAPAGQTGMLADPVYWYDHSGMTIDSTRSWGDDFSATYRVQTKRGIQILKWYLRLDSDLLISFIVSGSHQTKYRNVLDSTGSSTSRQSLQNLSTFKIGTETNYAFTSKLSATASAYYTYQKQQTSTSSTDATTTNDISMLFEITYKF